MFRATSCFMSMRTLLYRRSAMDFKIATISRFPTHFQLKNETQARVQKSIKERESCPFPPPPPPPQPKDDRLFWGAMAFLLLAGGFVVYAKGSPEIRDWLTLNAPWFDDLIAILYQENMTYGEFAVTCIEDTKRFISRITGDSKPKKCSVDGGKYEVSGTPEIEAPPEGEEEQCIPEPPPVVTRDICDIERCMVDLAESALLNYETAKAACVDYNALVESTMEFFSYRGMKALEGAMEDRITIVNDTLNNATDCINKLDEMVRYLDCGVQASKEQIKNSKLMHRDFHEKFKAAFMLYQWENDKSAALDRQWKIVQESIDKYTSENEAMFPELKYDSNKPQNVHGDVDIILYNSYRYIHHLNTQLNDFSDGMTDRINRALDALPQNGDKGKIRAANVDAAIKNARGEAEKDLKRREDELRARNEQYLKDSLKKQQDKHEASLSQRLEEMETEVMVRFNSLVAEKVAHEKRVMAAEREDMATKLKLVENQLEDRMKAERETRRSQELWAAGASLLAATKKGDPYVMVDKELIAIEKACQDDKLVQTVLDSIPDSVMKKGIVPESVLKSEFKTMEKVARSVALVEADGGPMPVYILSWLQGLLLFMKISGIPQSEFDKPPLEPPRNLDTFDLLQRARFWIERGNLAVAIRYVDSLKGASRAAASKWYDEARAHLEVRQAAEAVLAHAAALGLRYI